MNTSAILLLESPKAPRHVTLADRSLGAFQFPSGEKLVWVKFKNNAVPREVLVEY